MLDKYKSKLNAVIMGQNVTDSHLLGQGSRALNHCFGPNKELEHGVILSFLIQLGV